LIIAIVEREVAALSNLYPSAEVISEVGGGLNFKRKKLLALLERVMHCFNQAIAYQKKNGRTSKLKLRNIIMQSALPTWVKEVPCHIRQNAVFDAHQAFKASRDCKFRSCRAPRQTIKFNHN
jgi:hypothetical protein